MIPKIDDRRKHNKHATNRINNLNAKGTWYIVHKWYINGT